MEDNNPVIDKTRLVTYVLPADGKKPMSEKALDVLYGVTNVIFTIVVGFGIIWFAATVAAQALLWLVFRPLPYGGQTEFEPLVPWWLALGLMVAIIVAAVVVSRLNSFAIDEGYAIYSYVPQGMIVDKDTRGGGGTSLRWVLLVKGYNSQNELRTVEHTVTAGAWKDDHEVGGYFDTRDEEDRANSAFEPWVGFAPHEAS